MSRRLKWQNNKQVKKLLFQLVFSIYLHVVLLKFRLWALVGLRIKFHIQRVPSWNTFGGPHSMKNKKYMNKHDVDTNITFFMYLFFSWSGVHQKYSRWVLVGWGIEFLIFFFRGAGFTKSILGGYSLDAELNSLSNEWSQSKF